MEEYKLIMDQMGRQIGDQIRQNVLANKEQAWFMNNLEGMQLE